MSNEQNMRLVFESEITDIQPYNSSFDKALIRIAYEGQNRNKSAIDRAAFDQAASSLLNIPVVCSYKRDEDNLGGHDVDIVKTRNGFKIINVTQPVGVVPESTDSYWADVTEQDGTVRPYLHTSVLLWKRQEAYKYIKDHGICGQSMEITVKASAVEEDGFLHIYSFEYTALCLLGEGVTPCYESASLEMFSLNKFEAQLTEMMNDFKREFTAITASADGIDTTFPKGGNTKVNLEELMSKYELSAEDISGIDVSGMDLTVVEEKFAEIKKSKQNFADDENADEGVDGQASTEPDATEGGEDAGDGGDDDDDAKKKFSLTARQLTEALDSAVRTERFYDKCWREERCRFYYVDHDAEKSEVYCEDCSNNYALCGMPYTMNGDNVVIDFASCKRKKVVFEDLDDGAEQQALFAMTADYDAKIQKLNDEIDALTSYKLQRENDDFELQVAERLKKFADLSGNDVFDSLVAAEGHKNMTLDQIEDKCYAIRGRMHEQMTAQFALEQQKAVRVPVEDMRPSANPDEPYGNIFVEYGVGQAK